MIKRCLPFLYIRTMLTINSISQNSTFLGISFLIWTKTSIDSPIKTPMDLVGSDIVMNMVSDDISYKSFKTVDNSLIVATNKITIPPGTITLLPGKYLFDFDIILLNGIRMTGIAPGQWEILKPITVR